MEEYNANNMGDIRRLILTNSGSGRVAFPVTLVEGDNGEVGVKLFNYIVKHAPDDILNYFFKDDEIVYVHGAKISDAAIISDDMIAINSHEFSGNILVVYLFNTGVLTIVYD